MERIRRVNGDVINVARTVRDSGCNHVIIPHVCNNLGVMGAGVAAALAREWPQILPPYEAVCARHNNPLGMTPSFEVEPNLWVCNMIAQSGLGRSKTPLRYGALVHCMEHVSNLAFTRAMCIVAPMFGSGLAGGDWSVIEHLINEIWVDNDIPVTIAVL